MASKPTGPDAIPRWAIDATLTTDAANIVNPSEGQKDTGWTLGQDPPSSFVNWQLNRTARWIAYLNDGAFSGDHSINGGLHATEDLVSDALGVFGTGVQTPGDVAITGTGTLTVAGKTTLSGSFFVAGEISPTAITSTTTINDWNPTGLATSTVIRQVVTNSGGANVSISGMVAPASTGQIHYLWALGTLAGDTITLLHQNAGSAANNRFTLASGTNLVIPQNGCVGIRYDFSSSVWRSVSKNF